MKALYGATLAEGTANNQMSGIRRHLRFKKKMEPPKQHALDERIYHEDGTWTTKRLVSLSEEESQNPEAIMAKMGLDPLQWDVVSMEIKRNWWDTPMKLKGEDGTETPTSRRNYQFYVKMRVRPTQVPVTADVVAKVFEDLEKPQIDVVGYEPGCKMFELPIMDLHLAKYAWGEETGEDYDMKIADQLYRKSVLDILGKLAHYRLPIEKNLFPVGQDFFHVDNPQNETTAGTAMDVDTRWQKMFDIGVKALIWTVEQLRQIAPVEIVYVPGNHDKTLSYCAVYALHAWYQNCESVTVDLSPTARKYIQYGVNLIGFSHGKEGKRIQHLMQQEQPEAWGKTLFREWHLGDLHHEEAMEIGGVKIRRISSVTAADAWHVEKGFRAMRMAQAFVWDRDKGRELVIDSNVGVRD